MAELKRCFFVDKYDHDSEDPQLIVTIMLKLINIIINYAVLEHIIRNGI